MNLWKANTANSGIGSPALAANLWRGDIQALRGLAVLLVVADHFGLKLFKAGFLGVDVFFVISGFLMTGLIINGIDARRFTLQEFYARRARRLLPAAYATVIISAVVSIVLLDPFELRNFTTQVVGAFTFTINVVLWQQIDYFNSGAALKPLLHMWSLSLEEQYYLIVPIILLFCPAPIRLQISIVIVLLSFLMCFYLSQRSPSAAFYFLPFRAWELGIGSIVAILVRQYGIQAHNGLIGRISCVVVIFAAAIFSTHASHPGTIAALVCLATGWILLSGRDQQKAGILYPLMWVGDRSYTLYLVHWPVLALISNVYVGPPSAVALTCAVLLMLLWMELQYRFIEQRFRTMTINRRNTCILIAIPIAVIAIVFGWSYGVQSQGIADRGGNAGLSKHCDARGLYTARVECESQPNPKTLVWGDSIAMHLANGLAQTMPGGIAQASRAVCGPFAGLAPMDGVLRTREWAEQCISFNDSVFDHLSKNTHIDTVVLSSIIKQYVPGGEKKPWRALIATDSGYRVIEQNNEIVIASFKQTVGKLRAMGKRVVFVAPPPSSDFDIGRCIARFNAKKWTIMESEGCRIPIEKFHHERRAVLQFLNTIQERQVADIISFDQYLCRKGYCETSFPSGPLYVDADHFSASGSVAVARYVNLAQLVTQRAR